jgi:4'-phosphopantetheinyl transferase
MSALADGRQRHEAALTVRGKFQIEPGEIHVWYINCVEPASSYAMCRRILAAYLDLEPLEIAFVKSAYGKPRLHPSLFADIDFNLAHTGNRTACVVTRGCRIGIDMESVLPRKGVNEIVNALFTPDEQREWARRPSEERLAAFYRCWTRKEAVAKALGLGMSVDFSHFSVGTGSAQSTVRIAAEGHGATDLRVCTIEAPPGCTVAVAKEKTFGAITICESMAI